MTIPGLYQTPDFEVPLALIASQTDSFGFQTLDLAFPTSRFGQTPSAELVGAIVPGIDVARARAIESPACQLLNADAHATGGVLRASDLARARLMANFLVAEDPQRRLDARPVETLAHQISLVRHILDGRGLRRVLIADEVGLGKTVEAGLLLQELLTTRPGLRVLYLAPARLVRNVRREFDQLKLGFRQWTSSDADGRPTDTRLIASLHRAVHGNNRQSLIDAGPWDVLVVDECHHLSAWGARGGDTTNAFRLVRDLVRGLPPDGRLIMMSGTPHQGNQVRFRNLLSLLRCDGEDDLAIRGRVIYRTKEDVRDWNDRPLFPERIVRPPVMVDLGPSGRQWLKNIHGYFSSRPSGNASESARRASGWQCALSLQWAASSTQAGLGFLVRHAFRAGLGLNVRGLEAAVAAIRPYRNGPADEPIEQLAARIRSEVERQNREHDDGDIDDVESECDEALLIRATPTDAVRLGALLEEGTRLLQQHGDMKWRQIWDAAIEPASPEKVVLFAQPIETVCALARFLEAKSGVRPAMIIGGQSDDERQTEIERFRSPNGPRFLVSSRAGGEGINLQFARRLVHVDVPWNPMELEQRVGRVHRFGSRLPIIVDTIVTKDSREFDAYRVARRKLEQIAGTLVAPSRIEMMFSRVMSLVPPEELQDVLIASAVAPCSEDDEQRIAELVRAGFDDWMAFHDHYGKQQTAIRAISPGLAQWSDLADFCVRHAGAEPIHGLTSEDFGRHGLERSAVTGIRFGAADGFVCGDQGGTPILDGDGHLLKQLGLNTPVVANEIYRLATDPAIAGVAHFRGDQRSRELLGSGAKGILVWRVQDYQMDGRRGWVEEATRLEAICVAIDKSARQMDRTELASFVRWCQEATLRRQGGEISALGNVLKEVELSYGRAIWAPTPAERSAGKSRAVIPIFAATILD
jgi:superfamily II DNA or RNA helicase